jgi:uncharacterized membrane protein
VVVVVVVVVVCMAIVKESRAKRTETKNSERLSLATHSMFKVRSAQCEQKQHLKSPKKPEVIGGTWF